MTILWVELGSVWAIILHATVSAGLLIGSSISIPSGLRNRRVCHTTNFNWNKNLVIYITVKYYQVSSNCRSIFTDTTFMNNSLLNNYVVLFDYECLQFGKSTTWRTNYYHSKVMRFLNSVNESLIMICYLMNSNCRNVLCYWPLEEEGEREKKYV